MADILEQNGNDKELAREQSEFMTNAFGRLKDMGQGLIGIAMTVDHWVRSQMEVGNKLLLPETATTEDIQQAETALKDPQNATVEVNAIAQTNEGEIIRQPIADPWDEEINQVVDQAISRLDEPTEAEAVSVEAVIDNPEPVQTTTQDQRPLVNDYIEKAGETLQQHANEFLTQAEQFIQQNVQVTIEPIPQKDGSLAMSADKPSLLTRMSLAGGQFAQAAQQEMQKLAPQQYEQISQAVQNTQTKVDQAIDGVVQQVQGKLNQPSVRQEMTEVRAELQTIRAEIKNEFKTEIGELRSQVSTLELQISKLQQERVKVDASIQTLDAKPPLNNSKLNTWQKSFTNNVKTNLQKLSQNLGKQINKLKTQVKGLFETFKQKVGQRLQPLVNRLQPVVNQAKNIRADVVDGYNKTRQNVGQQVNNAVKFVGEKASNLQVAAINKSADHLFAKHGQSVEGGQVYQGDKYKFHRDSEGTLTITGKDQKTIYQKGEFNTQAPKSDKEAIVGATHQISENLGKKQSAENKQATQQKQASTQQQRPKALASSRRR